MGGKKNVTNINFNSLSSKCQVNKSKIVKKSFVFRNSTTKGELWKTPLFSAKK